MVLPILKDIQELYRIEKHEGTMEIDNNLVENAIRPAKLGAKNWLFFGSDEAGT